MAVFRHPKGNRPWRLNVNARRFDALIRHAATGKTRRQILGAMTTLFGISLALPGHGAAGCKKVGKKCEKNKDCCDHAKCQGKECKCKSGFTECDKKCFDLDKDEQHCGNCDTACATGESCVAGTCAEGGCTVNLDSCAPSALCTPCPDRDESVCYLDDAGQARCSRVILCFDCESDASCEEVFGTGARCIACAGQCGSGRACAAG